MARERKIDMVILGLLSHTNMTGYDIKKQLDHSIRFFWKGSFGNIYPTLVKLEEGKLVRKFQNDKPTSGRERIVYEITDAGRACLKEWLSDAQTSNEMKYEMLLKLFFGGAAEKAVSVATIEAFENEICKELCILKMYRDNLASVMDERDHMFFYLTVTFGVETYEGYLKWCKEAKEVLARYEWA